MTAPADERSTTMGDGGLVLYDESKIFPVVHAMPT